MSDRRLSIGLRYKHQDAWVGGVYYVQNLVRVNERAGAPGMATELRGRERKAEPTGRGGPTATGAAAAQPAGTRTPDTD